MMLLRWHYLHHISVARLPALWTRRFRRHQESIIPNVATTLVLPSMVSALGIDLNMERARCAEPMVYTCVCSAFLIRFLGAQLVLALL